MKKYLSIALLFAATTVSAQRASLKNDTLTYKDRHFIVGDTINIAYGSGTNGVFVFISIGTAMLGVKPLEANNSKLIVQVEKMYKSSGRLLLRCKVIEGIDKVPLVISDKIFIEPEGAIDKKELL